MMAKTMRMTLKTLRMMTKTLMIVMIPTGECAWWSSFHHLMVPPSSITDLQKDPSMTILTMTMKRKSRKMESVSRRCSPLVITLSSIVGIGTASKDLQLDCSCCWRGREVEDSFPMFRFLAFCALLCFAFRSFHFIRAQPKLPAVWPSGVKSLKIGPM